MTYRRLLAGNADFRRLWAGQVVSEVGDWLNNIAVLALVIELAGPRAQGHAVAVYAVARHLPLFVFGPVAGVVTDRVDRRRLMIAADLARAALALGFLVAPAWGSLTAIYVVGASLFSVSAFFNAAKRATLPNLVRTTEELLAANSLSAATTAATIATGSAVGGLVATFAGREAVFLLNAATFLASAEMIRRIRSPTAVPRAAAISLNNSNPQSAFRRAAADFRDGLRYVRADAVLAAIFVVAVGWGLGNGAARALYSIFGASLGESAVAGLLARPKDFGISVLFVAMGVGGVLGAPIARRFNSAGASLGARMGRSLAADGCGLFLFALMPELWSAALVLVAREINFAVWWTAQQTLVMHRTDNRFAGRVFATHEAVTTLAMVGSIYLAGASADRFGVRPVAAAGGACVALSGLLWFALRRRSDEEGKPPPRAGDERDVSDDVEGLRLE